MKFITYVLTAPRPTSTLNRTVDSLHNAGFRVLRIVDGSPPPGEKPSPKWCTDAYIRLFRSHLANHSDSEAALVFEDDVVVCRGLCEYLEKSPWPEEIENIALVSPYCCTAYSNYGDDDRWHREDFRGILAGTQAFLYTNRVMQGLIDELAPDRMDINSYVGVDTQLGQFCLAHDLHAWFHKPSLVQHVGIRNSAVGFTDDLGTIYSAESFVGEEFDARNLL